MNIIVDIDGVITTGWDFKKLIKKYFNKDVPQGFPWSYSLEDCGGIPNKMVAHMFIKELYAPPEIQTDCLRVMQNFVDNGDSIYIHTSRLRFGDPEMIRDWLFKYDVPFDVLVETDNDLPNYAHIVIDDSPEKLLCVEERIKVGKLLLFNQQWNARCLDLFNKFTRVGSWKEIEKIWRETSVKW